METHTILNPVRTANTVALAERIIATLDESPDLFARGKVTADAVAEFGPAVWALVNSRVPDLDGEVGRKRPISEVTAAVVVGMLAMRASIATLA